MTTTEEPPVAASDRLLLPHHRSELEASEISAEVAAARGYETLPDSDESRARLKDLRIPRWAWRETSAFPGLLMPMYRVTGEEIGVQWKPAVPQEAPGGKLQKYASQTGVPNRLDAPPTVSDAVRDPSEPLWITEGIKKGDCLATLGKAVITLTGVFNWRRQSGTIGDWEDVPLRDRVVVICFDSDARRNRNVMMAMGRLGKWLESKGARDVRYLIVPSLVGEVPVKGVDDFFHAGGTLERLGQEAMAALPNDARDATFTDAMLADTACSEELEGNYRWAHGLGWMQWTGKVWVEATEPTVMEAVKQWAQGHYHRAVDQQHANSGRDMAATVDGWRGVLSAGRLSSIVRLAKGVLETDPTAFDSDPDLMNCPNGIVDLRTGALQPHDPDLLMTKITGVDFVKDARHPDWDKALQALPEDVVDWYQTRLGQALTGHMTSDDTVIICQGGGANGKSTTYDACALAMGKYHVQVSDRVMLGNASDNHPTEIMDLMGARYAVLEETPESRRLDTNRLKKLAGTREITGRRIRQDPVTFPATHSLFINSNYKPVVDETDHGTWRRLALLCWPYTFRKTEQECRGPNDRVGDPTLRERIKLSPQALEAVLAWVAEGARRWYELERIMPEHPERVVEDTFQWRKESDLILAFCSEVVEIDLDSWIAGTELKEEFNRWLKVKGHREWADKTFNARFAGHDTLTQSGVELKIIRRRPGQSTRVENQPAGTTVRAWLGLRFRDDSGEGGEQGIPGNDPFGGPEPVPVTPVTGPPVNANSPYTREVSGEPVTGVTGGSPTDSGDQETMIHKAPATTPLPAPGDAVPGPRTPAEEAPAPGPEELPEWFTSDPFAALVEDVATPTPAGPEIDVSGPLGFDLETADADKEFTYGPGFVRLAGVIDQHGTKRTDLTPEELVEMLEAAPSAYGHNALGFDGLALAYYHGLDWEAYAEKVTDTEPVSRQAHPPRSRGKSSVDEYDLDHVAQRYGVQGKTDDIRGLARKHGGFDKIPTDDPEYNAYLEGDLDATKAVKEVLPEGDAYVRREHKILGIMGRMTLNGFKVDTELLHQRYREGQERKAEALQRLADEHGLPLGKTVMRGRGAAKREVFEPSRSPLATTEGNAWVKATWERYGLQSPPRTETGRLSTKAEELGKIAQHPRCPAELKTILELMGIVTTTRTVYQTALEYLAPDGRVHPTVSMRQASGRGSVTKPGMTVFGKRDGRHVERDIFIADDGHALFTCDLAQVDMRAIAGHSQDHNYMELFAPGRDAHQEIADQVGVTRQDAKAIGHGWNYGLGAKAMIERDGRDPEKVWAFVNGMQEAFPRLMEWREEVREIGGRGELLDNGFGRLMRCDPQWAYTVAPALMGQGGARDIMMEVLLRLIDRHPEYRPYLRTWVHDEIVFSVPEEIAEQVAADVKDAFTWEWRGVPIFSDLSRFGRSWGECSAK